MRVAPVFKLTLRLHPNVQTANSRLKDKLGLYQDFSRAKRDPF
jgi:hypothetical protein